MSKKSNSINAMAKQLAEFKDFIKSQNIIGMATGLVIGTASAATVKSLIDNIIMPPIGLLLGSAEGLKGLYWNIGRTVKGELVRVSYGSFLNDMINFIVIAAVIYVVITFVAKFLDQDKEK